MKTTAKRDAWVIGGLLALCMVPAVAGAVRLNQVLGGQVTQENARFLAAPSPVGVHIISATVFGVLGAFQFAPGFRRRRPRWHRMAGRVLVPAGLIVSLSGIWMTVFYSAAGVEGPAGFDGIVVYGTRLVVGVAMIMAIVFGVDAIWKRRFQAHEAWMIRAYALGMGAGTQVFTHLPWFFFPEIQGELSRAIFMAAGWGINAAVAEWVIRRASGTGDATSLGQLHAAKQLRGLSL